MIIAIDFDGTIVTDKFPEIGELKRDAKEVINKLYSEHYYIIIWTCRTHLKMLEAVEFLAKNGIKYNKINESCPANVREYGGRDTRKVFANLYIEDRSIEPLPDWNEIYEIIHQRFPTISDTGFPG